MNFHSSTYRRILSWGPVIVWMLLIFCMSAQAAGASNGLSTDLTRKLFSIIEKTGLVKSDLVGNNLLIENFNSFLRQFAHAFSYFVLAIFVLIALRIKGQRMTIAILSAFLLCAIYSITDEVHQFFVPGRAMQFVDFMTDCDGSLTALTIFGLMFNKDNTNRIHMVRNR